jgi:hypothetical protein
MTCLFCRLRVVSLLAMSVFGVAAGDAVAQPTGWVFEVHAGSMPDMAPGKVILQQLPPPGPGFTTPDGNVSRRVASWYFGDGSTLANSVADKLGGIPHIAPLDSVLTTSALTRTSGGVTGFRIGHTITRRVLVLLSYDQTQTRVVLTPSAQATIAATNASYKPYWDAWLVGPQVGNISTSSAVTFAGSEGTQRMISVAAEIRILTIRGWTPYVALGGGVSLPLPAVDATVTLLGHYEATLVRPGAVNNGAQVSETDQVQVRYELEPNGIGIFGAGVERSLARHLGVRAEVRSFLSANMIRTRIDTRPISGPMAPPFVNFRGGVNPDLQVSTTASPTSLSLLGVDHFDSFRAKGNLPTFIAGVFLRF